MTFSNAQSSKLKAWTSLFTETWQARRWSFELKALEQHSKMLPQGIGCNRQTAVLTLIAEALELWSFWLYESWVIYKNFNICDHHFRFLEFQKFKSSWVLFNHLRWRSAMAEEADAGLMQQSGQDLASWKCFPYICCARDEKSWLCRTYLARRVEEDTLLEVNRFEGQHHR